MKIANIPPYPYIAKQLDLLWYEEPVSGYYQKYGLGSYQAELGYSYYPDSCGYYECQEPHCYPLMPIQYY